MALTEEQKKKKKELEAQQKKAIEKAASAFKSNPSSIPKKYQSQAKETSKKQEKYSSKTAKKNYSVGKNGSIKAKATKATKNYISGKSSNASGKKLTGTEKFRNSPGWYMTQEERFLKQRQYNRTKNDMSADKLDSKTWNAKDEAETRYTITGNYAKYAQQTARQAKENAEKYQKTGDAKYLDQAKEDANRARVFQQRMNSSVGNAVQAEKDFGFYLTSQKYDQYTRSTNPEYKAEAERRDAESRENFLKDRLNTARKNFALAELTSLGRPGKDDNLEAARNELKAAQKAYDEVKGKSKAKAEKAEAAASDTYTEMFKGLKAVTKPNAEQQAQLKTIQDEAERLAGLTDTTKTQQAEIQQFLKKYKTLPKVAQNQEFIDQMESKSGTATARVSNVTSSALNQYAADVLRVPGMVDDAASLVMDKLNIDDTPNTDRAKKAEEATARAIKWMDKAADKFEGKASENREEAERGLGTIGKMGVDLGITLTQIGADAVSPIGALESMATRVAGGVYNQVKESGADTDDALLNAGMHAAVEIITERMFGLALPVYGRGSVDDLIEKAINKAAARVASKAGRRATKGFFRAVANFATEGGEELISAGFDPIIDAVTVGDKSDMKRYGTQEFWDDAMYQMVLGGVAGFVGGSVNQIARGFEDVDEKTLKETQDKKAAKNFVPVEISDFSQSLINNGIKNKAAVNADTVITNLVTNESEVTDKEINKMLDDLHITKKGAKTAGAVRSLTALKNRLGLTELPDNVSRADLVKAIREGARLAKQDKDMQTEADVRGMEEQAEAEQVRAEVDDAEATINENELKGRKILVPEFGDEPITFEQFHDMITEDVPGITEDMILEEWAGQVQRYGVNEEAPVEEVTEEPTPVEEEQTEEGPSDEDVMREVFGIEPQQTEEELPEDYNELAELEEKNKKERRNTKFKELIPEDSWFNGEDYQEANRISREARARSRELWEERHALEEELKSESSPKPKEEWTEEDEYNAILHNRPRNYTERGEEILKRIEEIQKSVRALDQMESEANERARKIKARASAEQTAQWVDSKPAKATQKEYEGFRTDTTNVPGYDQDLRNGKGYIAEVSPVEYLKRCAYDIFASAKTTLENQVAAVSEERIAEYTEAMANGDKFPMPYLNYGDTLTGQEGRHRAIAAYNLGIEKIPVFVLNYKAPNRINYEAAEVADEFVERELDEAAVESVEEELSNNTTEETTGTAEKTATDSEVAEEPNTTEAVEEPTTTEAVEEPTINPNLFTNSGKPLDEYITDRIKWTIKGASAEADADSITPTIMASFTDMLNADTEEVDSFINNVADSLGSEQLKDPLKYIFTEYKTHSQNENTGETTDTVEEETGIPDDIDFAYNEEAREQYGVEVEGPDIYDIPFALKPEEVKGKKMDILRKSVKNTVKDFGVKMTDEEVDQYAENLNNLFRDFERGYREEEIRDPETGELYNVKRTNFRDPATQQEAVEQFARTLIDNIEVDNLPAVNAYRTLYSELKNARLLYDEEDAREVSADFKNDRTIPMKKVETGKGNADTRYDELMMLPEVRPYLERAMREITGGTGVEENGSRQNRFHAIVLASQMMRNERTHNPFTDTDSENSQAYDYDNMVQMAAVDIYKMFTHVPSEGDTVVGKGQKLARVVMDPRTNAARHLAFEQIQALEDALQEVGATRPSFGKNLQRNSDNQVMSKEQTRKFERSVLRDNEGNMFVLYPVGNNQYTTTPTSNISRLQASYGNVTAPAEVQGGFRQIREVQEEIDRALEQDGVDGVVVHNVKMGDYEGDIVIPKDRSQMSSTIDYGLSNAPVQQENRPENAFRPAGQEAPTKKDGYTKYIEALRAKVKAKTKMDDEALDLSISQKGLVENPGEWNPRKNVSGKTELKKGMDSAYNIIQSFREHFGLQIGKGSIFTQKASGYYNTQTWEIRTRVHNDLPTVCHELGHHLDRQYFKGALGSFMDTTKGNTEADKAFRELLRNSDQNFLSNYKEKDHAKEAFAEYIREYFLDSDATEMRYPEFTKYFMNSISTRDRVMMQTFADDINAFFSVTADTAQSEIISAKQLDDDFSSFRSRVGRKWNNFYQKIFDSNHAIKRFDEETGGKAHLLASIAPHSRERAANVLLRGVMDGDKYVGPGLVSVLKPISKHDMADFNEYLVCKHGVERKAVKGEDYGVFADPRHNNTEWLQNRAAELEEKHPEFKPVSENLYQFLNNVNEVWGVKTGLLSQDTVDAWNKQWQYYVPFQRRMEDAGKKSLKGSKNGFANQSAGIHSTRGGSGRQIIEPITSIENYVINLVNAGVRNNVMREITQTATMFDGNTAQFLVREREPLQKKTVETADFKKQLAEALDMEGELTSEIEDIIEKMPDIITQYGRGHNTGNRVEVMVNGKPQTWRVTDPQLLESLVSMNPKTRNGALGIYQNCSRFIVGNITGNNILWSLTSNFPRDLVTYYTFAKTKNPIKLFGNLGSSYVQKTKDLLGGQTSQYYEEYLAMGGGHTSYYSSDVGTNAKILEKVHPTWKTYMNPMTYVSALADTIEFGPRYATYKLAREQGYTPEEAMFQAVDITVNFARGGTTSRELNVIFPFFNASLQGIDKFARWISANDVPKDNRAHATVARTAGFFTASAIAGALMWGINGGFDDDDEKKKHFAQLSNYTKNSFWTIPTSLFGSNKEGEYLCIPKAREINVLSSLITDALSYWENEDKEAFKEFKDYMSDNFLPSAGSAVVTMFTEDLGKGIDELLGSIGVAGPVFYIRANRDFLGRPIVPSYMLTSKEPQDIYKDTTTRLSKNVVDAVQKVAPNSFLKSVNPMQIDFFFQNTLGGWWKIYKALDPINPEYQDKLIGIKNQYFKYSTSSNDLVDSFYDKRDALTKKHGSSDSIDVSIQKKLYDNMATFYSGYNDMLKGMGKDEQRIAKQQMLDMMQSFMDSMDSGDYTSAQKDVFKFIRDNGLTDALPQGLKPELSYSLTKHGEYSNETTTTKKALNAEQYYNYQTEYLNNYYDGMSALIDSDWSDYEIEGMEGSQDAIKKKAANTMKSLAKSTTDAQLAAEWFDGKSNDQNLLNDLNTVGIELSDFAYLKSAFQYMENNHVYTDVLGETIKNGKQIYAANYIYALGDKYTAKQKDWIWNNAVSSDAYSGETLSQVPWNNGGVNGIKPQKKSKTKIKPQNYKYRNEAALPGFD